jgi:hypothetical protein
LDTGHGWTWLSTGQHVELWNRLDETGKQDTGADQCIPYLSASAKISVWGENWRISPKLGGCQDFWFWGTAPNHWITSFGGTVFHEIWRSWAR